MRHKEYTHKVTKLLAQSVILPFCLASFSLLPGGGCNLKLYELPLDIKIDSEASKSILNDIRRSSPPPRIGKKFEEERLVRLDLEELIDNEWGHEGKNFNDYIEKNKHNINTFAKNKEPIDGFLLSVDSLERLPKNIIWKHEKNEGVIQGTKLSFIHLSDVQLHDERVYMFNKELTAFFDKFVQSFEHKREIVFYDYSYYLTVIGTINLLCERLTEQNPKFMIHTGDAIDMGVISELYEFIYITNLLNIPWYNVLGNHDYPVYGNIKSEQVGVIRPDMGFQTVNSRYNFINMHGGGFEVDKLVYFSPSNTPHSKNRLKDSLYNGFDMQGKPFEASVKLEKQPEGLQLPKTVDSGELSYDTSSGLLIFRGAMTKNDRNTLLNESKDTSYQEKIEMLYKRSIEYREDKPCSCRDCPGYYHFEAKKPDGREPGVLCIVLDTTTRNFKFAKGTVYRHEEVEGPPDESLREEEIRWLEKILKNYRAKGNWIVLVFGHHQLGREGFLDNSYEKLLDLFLDPANNVIAYFCGHTHKHEVTYHDDPKRPGTFGFWEIVTNSIFEYPKRGSLVTIRYTGEGIWELDLQSFWPYFLNSLEMDAPKLLQDAKTCFDASKEDEEGKKLEKRFQKLPVTHRDAALRFVYPKI